MCTMRLNPIAPTKTRMHPLSRLWMVENGLLTSEWQMKEKNSFMSAASWMNSEIRG